jgi:hypothetical protein
MKKDDILKIIDEVMNNREIDSIRNAILAIRDKVIAFKDEDTDFSTIVLEDWHTYKIPLRSHSEIQFTGGYFEGANYLCVDACAKRDTREYGDMWYE